MQFAVGDKVVHPHHGPGRITGIERRELLDGKKLYYEIEIPAQELSVYLPGQTMKDMGVRPAMSRARFPRVLARLREEPHHLPQDYKERQEGVWEQLRTGRTMLLAEIVRDLAWHEDRDHLTKKDTEYLAQAKGRLAAELALVCGTEVPDMERRIDETLNAAISDTKERERRRELLSQMEDGASGESRAS
jgi:CarD family transcriptional regulator